MINKNSTSHDQSGTPVYMAPEIIKNERYIGFPIDIWSSGTALYIMLTGNVPFNKTKLNDLQYEILNTHLKNNNYLSLKPNNLIQGILCKDPNKRFSVDDILNHPWLNNYDFYNLNIGNINKYYLFTNDKMIMLNKTYIDYRKANKEELYENFTLKNLYILIMI